MTTSTALPRPAAGDAAAYYFRYIDLVPGDDPLAALASGLDETRRALAAVRDERFRYEAGKWSVREVIGHVLDTERVFGYRAFHMARGGEGAIPGMDQDVFAAAAGADERPLAEILDELDAVRRGHLAMFRAFDAAAWERTGVASGNPFKVRAFPWILAGHEIHHRRVLVERYAAALK